MRVRLRVCVQGGGVLMCECLPFSFIFLVLQLLSGVQNGIVSFRVAG